MICEEFTSGENPGTILQVVELNLNDHFILNGYSVPVTETPEDVTGLTSENKPTYEEPFHIPILAEPNKLFNPAQQFDFIHSVTPLETELDVYFHNTSNS